MASWSFITRFLGIQAVGLVPEDKANGAKPMETDADGPNKRRRISNRVYVGSSDLSYRREHMEVCSAKMCSNKLASKLHGNVRSHHFVQLCCLHDMQVEGALHQGLYQDMDIVQELWDHAFK